MHFVIIKFQLSDTTYSSCCDLLSLLLQVRVSMQIQEGVKFLNHGGRGHTFDQCLQAKESLTTQVELVFNELGQKRIHG